MATWYIFPFLPRSQSFKPSFASIRGDVWRPWYVLCSPSTTLVNVNPNLRFWGGLSLYQGGSLCLPKSRFGCRSELRILICLNASVYHVHKRQSSLAYEEQHIKQNLVYVHSAYHVSKRQPSFAIFFNLRWFHNKATVYRLVEDISKRQFTVLSRTYQSDSLPSCRGHITVYRLVEDLSRWQFTVLSRTY